MGPGRIIQSVSEEFSVDEEAIMSPLRSKAVSMARHEAMCRIAETFPMFSWVEIGRMFNRDHSTVIYAWKTMRPGKARGSTPPPRLAA